MKISKTRLKEIIKEELEATVSEPIVSPNQEAQVELQSLANQLGASEDFVSTVRQAIAAAASTHADAEAQALGLMIKALETLSPMQEGDAPDEEASDDDDALVLPDRGAAGVKKSRERMKHRANELERQKKLRYKNK